MTDILKTLNRAIANRFENMSTEELLRLRASLVPAGMSESPPVLTGLPAPRPSEHPATSLKAALWQVMQSAERPLTSNEIVARVIAVRPGSPDPSIRSEISRARKLGVIKLNGDPRGGTYTANVSRSTMRATGT